MGSDTITADGLKERIEQIREAAGAEEVGIAVYDVGSGSAWDHHGDEWFHAASTIKIAVLVGVFAAIDAGDLTPDSRVHVRNRFFSIVDGAPYRIDTGRDANSDVHARVGMTMRVSELAYHMIVTSSNLATNLLVDLVGLERMQRTLAELGVQGIELRRGVEDERAYEEGINNRVTARGLVQLLRLIEEGKALSPSSCEQVLEILHEQEFRSGIPAGVPGDARVANKTGEISTVAHDAGIVYPPDRPPYALAVLTRWDADAGGDRRSAIARVSRAVFEWLNGEGGDG